MINEEIQAKISEWKSDKYDAETRKEVEKLLNSENTEEITDSFYKDLEFGTGGLRGIMGVGSNRMNKYTIGAATQGYSNYLKKNFSGEEISVAIAYDSRNNSELFSQITAGVFSANGIKVYLYESLRPTPQLSYTIRKLECKGGVVLTASHNPKEYNGYKAYWDDGGQVVPPHDKAIIEEVKKIKSVDEINFKENKDLIEMIGEKLDQDYIDQLKTLSIKPEVIKNQKDLKIVYSPIHGTGIKIIPEVLKQVGFEQVHLVEEQSTPDGNFSTVVYPNPEEAEALSMALKKAEFIDADVLMGTDPDTDRVGIAVKNKKGEFELLNGNQTGALIVYYVLEAWKSESKFKGNEYVAKTIVTTELIRKMCESYGVNCYDTLTGFKYIANLIKEKEGKETYIAGGEESYGYLLGEFVRDKDACAAALIIAELAAYAKSEGLSVYDLLIEVYVKFGLFREKLISITKKGASGAQQIQDMMISFRNNPPKELAGSKLISIKDYSTRIETHLEDGSTTEIKQPSSNVLQFLTADGYLISARPSGTEPKIKFYVSVNTKLSDKSKFDHSWNALGETIDKIVEDLGV